MAPTTGVVQQLLGGNSMAGLSSLTDATTAGTNATVSTLERLIARVGELETALVKALDKSGRAVADSVYYDPAAGSFLGA
jgi:3-hydroxy-3-methylglutaryl CoA synthase